MEVRVLVTLVAVVFIVLFFSSVKKLIKRQEAIEGKIKSITGFTATQKFVNQDATSAIAIDEKSKRVCIVKAEGDDVKTKTIRHKDILSSEIFEDGQSIVKTVRSSQIGGAVVGGILLGGVGAIIGGLSGKKKNSDNVKRVDVRLTIN